MVSSTEDGLVHRHPHRRMYLRDYFVIHLIEKFLPVFHPCPEREFVFLVGEDFALDCLLDLRIRAIEFESCRDDCVSGVRRVPDACSVYELGVVFIGFRDVP